MPTTTAGQLRSQTTSCTSGSLRPPAPCHSSSLDSTAYWTQRRGSSINFQGIERPDHTSQRHPDQVERADRSATLGDSASSPKSLAAKLVFELHKGKHGGVQSQAFASSRVKDNGVKTDENSARPILVAVRCRPRKRQRNERRTMNAAAVRRNGQEPTSTSTSDSDSDNCSSDDLGSIDDTCSPNIRRGVFEYPPSREYTSSGAFNGLPSRQRPRRLHVQAPVNGSGALSGRRSFDFDFVLPPWKKQRDVYDECVQTQIQHVLQSHHSSQQPQHATIVAYGQTGTGKTYTMGMLSDFSDDAEQGLIPRSLRQIMSFAAQANAGDFGKRGDAELVVTMSFLQIYLETIQDLLVLSGTSAGGALASRRRSRRRSARWIGRPEGNSGDLPVRQGQDGGFYVAGLSEYDICSMEDAHALLELATRNRVLASTARNKTSSRSHTLLTISLKRRCRSSSKWRSSSDSSMSDDSSNEDATEDEEDVLGHVSTISFVDLAGSERVEGALHFLRATRAHQELRIREAKFINRSLSALGGVIAALAQPKASQRYESPPDPALNALARLQSSSSLPNKRHIVETNGPVKAQQQHIRFRDSQLTKLLQARLVNGRGRLVLVATVDDQPKNLAETLSTLKFASQCRRVELQRSVELGKNAGEKLRRRRDRSRLEHLFADMKAAHENREAELHRDYQVRIQSLESELEEARKSLASLPTLHSALRLNLASYTALCSLMDYVSSTSDPVEVCAQMVHPRVDAFQSEEQMLQYVTSLYRRLKTVLGQSRHYAQPVPPPRAQSAHGSPSQMTTKGPGLKAASPVVRDSIRNHQTGTCQGTKLEKAVLRPRTIPSSGSERLSAEHEAEFRVIARHLLSTHALDSLVVSSSEDEQEKELPTSGA